MSDPIQELESYIEVFQEYTHNIAIGITHSDLESPHFTQIYKDWLIQQDLYTPSFFVDARQKDDILLLLEALITSIEVNHNLMS